MRVSGGIKLWLKTGAAAAALATFAQAMPAYAQEQAYNFDIPSQNLGAALKALARTSNQQIVFSEETVRGKTSPRVVGRYTVDEGLKELLAGSGIPVNRTGLGVIYVGNASARGDQSAAGNGIAELVVTGSRIRRTDVESASPITVLDEESMIERGYTNLGQLLNQVTSNTPSFPVSQGQGFPGGNAKTSPNLFNLGSGRTLTLINGRRGVATSSGLGDRSVDSGSIPQGLIKRVEVVNAGGAAIYGSDAIAGVVNYILKDNYQGLSLNAQYGVSSRGDNPKYDYSLLWGRNFADGKGNIAIDLDYSKTRPLLEDSRPSTANSLRTVTNLANVSPIDGRPPTIYVENARLWQYNPNGVLFSAPSGSPNNLLRSSGQALQFSPDGHVIPYDTGAIQGTDNIAVGGEGLDTRQLSTLGAGLERWSGSLIGHYDLTDRMKVSGELYYGRQVATDPIGTQQIFRLINGSGAGGPIVFNNTNPFLSASDIAALSAASPAFASGGNLYVGRYINGLPTRNRYSRTDVWRGALALDGDFDALNRNFYYSVSYSHGVAEGVSTVWAPWLAHLQNSLSATRNSAGQIVCSINADAIATNDDAKCVPLNPFGTQTVTPAATAYISALTGSRYFNTQDNTLATIGGDVIKLPGGTVKFSLAYEHREEKVHFRPFDADILGITTTGSPSSPRDGGYKTNEASGELLIPIVGGDFTLPLIEALEVNGSYRYVDNSVAGTERVWGVGGRWTVGYGLTFRATKSRNFRAPSLDQLFAPRAARSGQPLGADPCDSRRLPGAQFLTDSRRNCLADFTANPGYGSRDLATANQTRALAGLPPLADTPEQRLALFVDPAENTGLVTITSGGNPDLKNEIAKTTTYGLAYQPKYIPGLTFTADAIDVNLSGALVSLSASSFAGACYGDKEFPGTICGQFARDPTNGWITSGESTTFNAGFIHTKAEIYNLSYFFPIGRYFNDRNLGNLTLAFEGTHTTLYETQTIGFNVARQDDTIGMPDWRTRFDVRWSRGPLRLFWSLYYLPPEIQYRGVSIEADPVPKVKANITQSASLTYTYKNLSFRAGANNLFDTQPSYPTRSYGDVYGRQYFMGVRATF